MHLRPKAVDFLSLLVSEAPRVVPEKALHERLWPGVFVSDATLVSLIKELRRALDDHNPSAPVHLCRIRPDDPGRVPIGL